MIRFGSRAIFLLAVSAAGCNGPRPALGEQDREAGLAAVAMDDYAEDNVSITGQKLEALPDGRKALVTRLYNRRDEPLSIEVQVDFLDAQGFASGDVTNWELILIGPNESVTHRVPSLSQGVDSAVLRMRRPAGG